MRRGLQLALLVACLGLVFPGSAGAFGPLSSFGSFGEGAGRLSSPGQVAVDAGGNLYVADSGNNRISVFSGAGTFLRAFGKSVRPGGGDVCTIATGCRAGLANGSAGALWDPVGVAIGPAGNVFVSDRENNRIAVFSAEGEFTRAFGKGVNLDPGGGPDVCTSECKGGESGDGAGFLDDPVGIEFDAAERLYVADSHNARIDVFTPGGAFVLAFGKDVEVGGSGDVCTAGFGCEAGVADGSAGAMDEPQDVALAPTGELLIADRSNGRVDVFTRQGAFVESFGDEGPGQLSAPVALATDGTAQVYVADHDAQRIERFDAGVGYLGGFAAEPGVAGVGVACQGNVFAVEEGALFARIERFGEPETPSPPCGETPPTVVPIDAPAATLPSNKFHFAGLVKNRGNGSAVLYVRVPGPGRVILRGRGVRRRALGVRRAERVPLPVRPKIPLKRFLKRHGKGRIRVEVTFEPVGGVAKSLEKVILLRRRR